MFKSRAALLEASLKAAGVKVSINKEKPRKGAFVVTSGDAVLLELLDMVIYLTKIILLQWYDF